MTSKEIDGNDEKLIKHILSNNMSDSDFYNASDISYDIYQQSKINKLNQNHYIEARIQTPLFQDTKDNAKVNDILFTYYLNR